MKINQVHLQQDIFLRNGGQKMREDLNNEINRLEYKKGKSKEEEITLKVYRIFTQQPSMIGPSIYMLKPLSFSNYEHRLIFLNSVEEKIASLKKETGFSYHQIIDEAYRNGQEIIFKGITLRI